MTARTLAFVFAGVLTGTAMTSATAAPPTSPAADVRPLELGNFSVSLAVKDIQASRAFYEKLDFKVVGGKLDQKWLVMQSGTTTIGLFQGMFPKNILTFNPGWTKDKKALDDFQDVRELQIALKARGLTVAPEADESSQGTAYFQVTDPDGNTLLFDQHVPKPKR